MNRKKRVNKNNNTPWSFFFFFCLCFLLIGILPSTFANNHQTSVHFYDDAYYYGDDGSVRVCGTKDVRFSCYEGTLREFEINNSCNNYLFSVTDFSCSDPYILAETVEKKVPLSTYRMPIQTYYNMNNNLSNPVDVAYSLYTQSISTDTQSSMYLLNVLRDMRNEKEKCWPEEECDISTTTSVLYYLDRAGYNKTLREYQDARLWLESLQIQESIDNYRVVIDSTDDTQCNLRRGSSSFQALLFSEDDTMSHTFTLTTTSDLNITCTDNFEYELYDPHYTLIASGKSTLIEEDPDLHARAISFKPGCLPFVKSRPQTCDLLSTTLFLQLQDISEDALSVGQKYLSEYEYEDSVIGAKVSDDMIKNIYAFSILDDEEIKEDLETWILYSQNNDGGFEQNETITLEALRILNTSNEWTQDAESWIFSKYEYGGWDDIYTDILMYELYEPNVSAIKLNDGELTFTSSTQTLDFSQSAIDFELEKGSIFSVAAQNSTVQVGTSIEKDGIYFDKLVINDRLTYPLVTIKEPELQFNIPPLFYLIKPSHEVTMQISPSDSIQSCVFHFSDIFEKTTSDLANGELIVSYSVQEDDEYTIDVSYECNSTFRNISGEESFTVIKESSPPLSVELTGDGTIKDPYKLHISNEISRSLPINLKWQDFVPTHPLVDDFVIDPNQKSIVTIGQSRPTNLAENVTEVLVISSLGYEEQKNISLELVSELITAVNPSVTIVEKINWLRWIVYGSLFLFVILIIGIYSVKRSANKKKQLTNNKKQPISPKKREQFHNLLKQIQEKEQSITDSQKEHASKELNSSDSSNSSNTTNASDERQDSQNLSSVDVREDNSSDTANDDENSANNNITHATKPVEVYVELQRSLGVNDEQIKKELKDMGYSDKELSLVYTDLEQTEKELELKSTADNTANDGTADDDTTNTTTKKENEDSPTDENKEK